MINWLDFFYLTFKDITTKNKEKKQINGIWCYCGLYGEGKTLSMSVEAFKMHEKGYNVYSNYGLEFQDGHIVTWQDVINVPPNSVICLDEISNLVNSRDWKNLPPEFFGLLTQNRKLNIRIMATAQMFEDIDKQFRTLVRYIVQCHKIGRLESNRFYTQQDYAHTVDKRKNSFIVRFVVKNEYFKLYDTFEFIQKLKKTAEYTAHNKIISI